MAQEEIELAPSDQSNLLRLEKVGKGTVLTRQIADLVGRSQFFAEFSREDITVLADYMEVYRAQPGEMIIREGDAGDFMLLIVEGDVDILKKGARGEQQHMTSVGPGMTLGEMSMIDGEPRFATCLATHLTLFAVLSRDNMAKIILDHPSLGSKILVKLVTMLSLRLRQTSAKLLHYLEGGA
ncbi:MAG TPA: cyclic nucleotide-binding domain-containing protein [Burkholderiales bacterium]|jgi:CRP-like cAMP-binding protein|nr:cyclic nucleotide-binding domain-containing protein [Burkholderiales bacterium]